MIELCQLRIASRMGLLLMLAMVRCLFWFVEQPASSLLECDPYIAHLLAVGNIVQPIYRTFLPRPELCAAS